MKRSARIIGLLLLAVLGAVLVASFGGGSFTVHMVVHMGIVAVAAPLIACGKPGTRLDAFPGVARMTPMLASFVELVAVWFWHLPALRMVADASFALSLIEQASFLAAGVLLWRVCFRPGEGRLAGAAGLLFTSMHMTLLGVLLALAPRPLYGEGDVSCFGFSLSAAADQQIGGVVMLMVGACAYLVGGIVLLAGLLREDGGAMLIGWKQIAGLVLAGMVAAFLVAWSGIIGVGASTGHWKATDWFLHWVMRSSVRTAAIGTPVPAFTEGMLPMAAGHFEKGCALCHGSPALPPPASVRNMLPAPPDLKDKISEWSDAELFQVVQHGVRFTGMPAWPVAGREDEAWAMVAFLRRYPQLDAAGYRDLAGFAAARSTTMDSVIETCNGCHAPDRLDGQSLIPQLAGQSVTYLEQALAAYAGGTRGSGVMAVAIEGLDDKERRAIARHFARRTAALRQTASADAARGEALALKGDPAKRIPACLSCHDKTGANPAFPSLSGQTEAYLANQLRLFVGKKRGGGPFSALMTQAATNLEDSDIVALAAYFATRGISNPQQ